jgi:hypothetical protein
VTPGDTLVRGRALAEQASPMKLKHFIGDLLAFGRVADGELYIARAVNVTAPANASDMGTVIVRFSRLQDSLSMSLDGWVVVRVASGGRVVGPTLGDYQLARRRLTELGATS